MKALYEHDIDTNNYTIVESILAEVPEEKSWALYFAVADYLETWKPALSKSGYRKIYRFCKKHNLKPLQVVDWYFCDWAN